MPVPKKKTSVSRRDKRRSHHGLTRPNEVRTCPQCAEPMQMHTVCSGCGFYRGKEIIEIPVE